MAVGKGKSMNMRLQWLQGKVHEQADALEESLVKDPFAGRHDMIKQEKLRAIQRQSTG